ncbi:hypothetical protein BM535_20540 [Clostridioides difficile]|nr:hypothetical protein BM535_20540 [Clostridioides difficile]
MEDYRIIIESVHFFRNLHAFVKSIILYIYERHLKQSINGFAKFFLNIFGLEKAHLNCRLTIHMNYASQRI